MKNLDIINKVKKLKKSNVKNLIDKRIKEFEENGKNSCSEIFKELCFCILTANFNAEKSIRIQNDIRDGFLNLSGSELAGKLKKLGHRYPNTRACYIVYSRKYKDSLKDIIGTKKDDELREWLVKNIRGIGWKESSHFLRNIGYKNLAIIDFHIIDILTRYRLIERPKTLTKRKYLEIEDLLRKIARELDISMAELDLYLWFTETGKVLK